MSNTSLAQLRKAIEISEKIEQLEQELREVLGSLDGGGTEQTGLSSIASSVPAKRGGKPKSQPVEQSVASGAPAGRRRKKRVVSPEARAKMAAAQRRRWAKARR